jgi:serine/threonine protein phosphatase PrpC
LVCPRCGSSVSPGDLFCENCGRPLSADAPADGGVSGVQTCNCPPGQSKPDADGYCEVCGLRCLSDAEAARRHAELAVDGQLAVVSDIGRRHRSNEDAGTVARGPGDSVILVVADGVSAAIDSASASAVAIDAALGVLMSAPEDAALADVARAAVDAANQAVLGVPYVPGDQDGPESTIVVALCRRGRVGIGWAGDSRAYLIGLDTAEILTVDDSWVEQVVQSGEMPREQAEADSRAHYVTQVLGMRDQQLDGHSLERELPENGVLLLCSDGLWNYFERDGELAEAVRQLHSSDALSLCRWLVDAANERGGHDNVTVAVFMGSLARSEKET